MRVYSLTSKRQKLGCLLIDLFFGAFYLSFFLIGFTPGVVFYVFLGLVVALCAIYTLIIFNSRIRIDPEAKKLLVTVFQKTFYDLENVLEVRIQTKLIDRKEVEIIGLFGAGGTLLGEINPHFAMGTHPEFASIVGAIREIINKND